MAYNFEQSFDDLMADGDFFSVYAAFVSDDFSDQALFDLTDEDLALIADE